MEQEPQVTCPSCGSASVERVSLWLIPAQYYNCAKCVITFRKPPLTDEPPDFRRFNDGWTLPPEKAKK